MACRSFVEANRWRARKRVTVQPKDFPRQPFSIKNTFVELQLDGGEKYEPESPGARSAPGTFCAWSSEASGCGCGWDEDRGERSGDRFDKEAAATSATSRWSTQSDLSVLSARGQGPEKLAYDEKFADEDEGGVGCSTRAPSPQQSDIVSANSIGGIFRVLRDEDPQCVVMVRRIHKMGLGCEDTLTDHFSRFGPVSKALLVHSRAPKWRSRKAGGETRVRQGNFGFIVMEDPRSVERILEAGREQAVDGRAVVVMERFDGSCCQ